MTDLSTPEKPSTIQGLEVSILRLEPGDIVVLHSPLVLPQHAHEYLLMTLGKVLAEAGHPNVKALVLDKGHALEVLRIESRPNGPYKAGERR